MSGTFSCPCDAPAETPPLNPPGLPIIAYRDATFPAIRAALLTPQPGETQLTAWRPGATGDLAVMMAEWWAYLGDILTFYNERIANEDYLGTATQAASVTNLIRILGYRPQPGIGATVTLAALLQPGPTYGQTITLPVSLQVQSKPSPGQPPQTFELYSATSIAAPDAIAATAPLSLLSPSATTILLNGAVSNILGGDFLILRPRAGGSPSLVAVGSAAIAQPAAGPKQTTLTVSFPNDDAPSGPAAGLRLDKPTQTTGLWSLGGSQNAIDSQGNIHLAGLVRGIKIGDPVIFTYPLLDQIAPGIWVATGYAPRLCTVLGVQDLIWDGTGNPPGTPVPSTPATSILIPHTVLTVTPLLPSTTATGAGIATFNAGIILFYNFVEAASLLDQPVPIWPGPNAANPPQLIGATPFPPGGNTSVLIADTTGAGIAAQATTSPDQTTLAISGLPATPPSLQTPLSVMFNLLKFTRGKTVTNEVLGSGDPTTPNQTFTLAKSPLTYLRPAATAVSTLSITVNGQPWTEVPFLFAQDPSAQVFVTSQDANQITTVMFGDGVNGARLPAGRNNVIANYRFGSGVLAPPAGALTVIANPYPGLRALRNPVAAGGGADPDPPSQIATYAPRSVLTFGRAISALDFQAIAAQAAGGVRVAALWGWDSVNQRGGVTVYVADDGGVLADVQNAMAGAGDPNRPVTVLSATAIEAALIIEIILTPTANATAVQTAITTALADPVTGLFGARKLGIGQSVFNSQIAAACQSVPGYAAIEALYFLRADKGFEDTTLHQVPAGAYFDLAPADVWVIPQGAANG